MKKTKRGYMQIKEFYPYLKFPYKYKGDRPITLRSSWEIKVAQWLDRDPACLEWNSETIVIPYNFYDPKIKRNRKHRYFTDFYFKVKNPAGEIEEYLVEVKPYAETQEPKKPRAHTKAYSRRMFTYLKNQAKWDAARFYCEELRKQGRNIKFEVLTEKDIPVK